MAAALTKITKKENMKFTYQELEDYSDNLNSVKINVHIVEGLMAGAFMDNSQECDIHAAIEQTAYLITEAKKLLESLAMLTTIHP